MHIVHILKGKANPETMNGVNKAVHGMATGETNQGHHVEVWGITASVDDARKDAYNYKLRLFSQSVFRVAVSREMKRAIAELDRNTWIQFHSVFVPEFPSIAHMVRKRGLHYGVTTHGGYAPAVLSKDHLRKCLYIALRERPYVAGASLVQAVGRSEIKDILAMSPHARVELIPNGQDRDLLAGIEVPRMEAEHPVIGYCGRLDMQTKGLDHLINGFSIYKSEGGRGQLWMVGDGADRAAVERMATDGGVQSDVKFFGSMSGTAKLRVLSNFDAFIHTSRREALPTACLEAASLGTPLIVSRETNLADCVEEAGAGIALDETSADGVSRALGRVQALYKDNQLQSMGRNARLLIEKRFSWEGNARSFVAAIEAASHAT